jgi:hypothetical protein
MNLVNVTEVIIHHSSLLGPQYYNNIRVGCLMNLTEYEQNRGTFVNLFFDDIQFSGIYARYY